MSKYWSRSAHSSAHSSVSCLKWGGVLQVINTFANFTCRAQVSGFLVMREYDVASRQYFTNMLGVRSSTFDFAQQTSVVDERRFAQVIEKVRMMDQKTGRPLEHKADKARQKDPDSLHDREREPSPDDFRDGRSNGKVCRYWRSGQECPYGSQCKFPHGWDESAPTKRRRVADSSDSPASEEDD